MLGGFFCKYYFTASKMEKSYVSFLDKNKGIIYNKRYEKTHFTYTNFPFLECVL